jgi:aspartate racemase
MNYPMNETYRWDPAEGIIGVVGVAPAATADFYQRVIALTPARKDWEHVRVLIDSNPKLPSRGRHLDLGETDPSPFLRESICELANRGASVVAVPCNTAHILYERYAAGLEDLVPNMIDVAVDALIQRCGGAPRQLAVLGSSNTVKYDLYGQRLAPLGGDCLDISRWQPEISALIEHVKQSRGVAAAMESMGALLAAVAAAGADACVVACTELSVLVRPEWVAVPVIDGNVELARHCLNRVRGVAHAPIGC